MKTRKVHFGEIVNKDCKRELLKRPDLPVCVRRKGIGIHDDFRPFKPNIPPEPNPPKPSPKPPAPPAPPSPPSPPSPPKPPAPPAPPAPPKPSPFPEPSKSEDGLSKGEIIGIAGAIGSTITTGYGITKALEKSTEEMVQPEIEMTTMAESETTGTGTSFEQISASGLRQRGATQAVETTIEDAPAEITAIQEVGESAEAVEAGVSAFEVAGESTALLGTEAVAGGASALLGGAVASVALGAVATIGALGYFVDKGLFDFKGQADSFQKGEYNTTQEVATRQPPKLMYVPPDYNSQDISSTMAYLQRKDQAQADYERELADYKTAINTPTPAVSPSP